MCWKQTFKWTYTWWIYGICLIHLDPKLIYLANGKRVTHYATVISLCEISFTPRLVKHGDPIISVAVITISLSSIINILIIISYQNRIWMDLDQFRNQAILTPGPNFTFRTPKITSQSFSGPGVGWRDKSTQGAGAARDAGRRWRNRPRCSAPRRARADARLGDWSPWLWLPHGVNALSMWKSNPRCSMDGIFNYIWVIFGVNVGKYTIHGASGNENMTENYPWFI